MINNELLIELLNLPDIEIEKVVISDRRELNIYIKSTKEGAICRQCGKTINYYYGHSQEIRLRHLPIFEYKTFLIIQPKRYQCQTCDQKPTTTQQLDWYTRKSPFTRAYEQEVMRSLINSTIQDVSLKLEIGPDAIEGILDRQLDAEIDWAPISTLETIGIDEISLKKGHRDFAVIISAYVENELTILGVLTDRAKASIEKFFRSIPKRLRKTVRFLCSDLYSGFIGAARAVFGRRIAICADRFHVAKLYREGVEDLRKKELRCLKQMLSKKQYATFKNIQWLLRKPRHDLTSDQRRILNQLFRLSPKLEMAYSLSNSLTEIYEMLLSKGQGARKMRGWMQRVVNSKLTCFNRFLKTLKTHFDEITNYFIHRLTSGFVEGLNNKIKVLKRRCYGIMNPQRLFQRVSLDLGGYVRFARSTA